MDVWFFDTVRSDVAIASSVDLPGTTEPFLKSDGNRDQSAALSLSLSLLGSVRSLKSAQAYLSISRSPTVWRDVT